MDFVSPKVTLQISPVKLALSGKSSEGECWDPTSQQPVFFAYLFGPAAYSFCRREDQEQTSISLKKCMPRSQKIDKMIKCPYCSCVDLESDGFSINMSPGWLLENPSWQRSMTTATVPLLHPNFLCCPIDPSHVCFSGKASKKLSWAKNGGRSDQFKCCAHDTR